MQWILLLALCVPAFAFANAGVPMIFLGVPFMLAMLIPVIGIEIFRYSKVRGESPKQLWKRVTVANLVSTVAGYPLSWLLLLGVEFATTQGSALGLSNGWTRLAAVTLQAAWLIPYESELWWMIPIAGIVGLVPAFFLSIWLERAILKFPRKEVLDAHILSYLFLVLVLVVQLIVSIPKAA